MDSNIFPVDNLYILDVEGNQNTQSVLDYFDSNIQKYNGLTRRKLRIYRITRPMIKEGSVLKGLKQKGITILPTLEIFQPVSQIFTGVNEIIAFIETLFKATISVRQRQMSQEQGQFDAEGSTLMDDTNQLYDDFYKNEIRGKENEDDVAASMSTNISDGYRGALERRAGKRPPAGQENYEPTIEDAPPSRRAPANGGDAMGGGPMVDNVSNGPPGKGKGGKGDKGGKGGGGGDDGDTGIMASVRKAAQSAGADADLEIGLFQNKFDVTEM